MGVLNEWKSRVIDMIVLWSTLGHWLPKRNQTRGLNS